VSTHITRRAFSIAASGALSAAAAAQRKPIRFGGPIFLKSDDPRELAREHRKLGYSAAYCPPRLNINDRERIRDVEKAYAAENVVIAEVGVWVNMLDPDAEKRVKNLELVTTGLALAEAVGARCCVDIAGSYNPKIWYGPHPKNFSQEFFDATVGNCRSIIDAVKPKRTKFTIEMMGWAVPDGPDSYLKLIRAVDRPAFAVHLDVCNGISTPARFYDNAGFIRECFRKLGPWIASCHAKDLQWPAEMNVHFVEVAPGLGEVDYRAYLSELAALPTDPPLMLEHLKTAEDYAGAATHIRRVANELTLEFA
jgi:sugar phosphate isomerase/epimerase